jgi:hypothetical protein
MSDYVYDQQFHDYTMRTAIASARSLVKVVLAMTPVSSLLDVGCSRGSWLKVWNENGVEDMIGIDGHYVDQASLLFDRTRFIAHDLSQPFRLGRRFDLVQCMEVAEHLPAQRAAGLVADLVAHGPMVLFSAAPPGQGGENHINERPYEYWQEHFARHDYLLIDCLRPLVSRWAAVAPWYKYNSFLFIHRDILPALPAYLRLYAIESGQAVPDVSPVSYRIRKALVRLLPFRIQQFLAKTKAKEAA